MTDAQVFHLSQSQNEEISELVSNDRQVDLYTRYLLDQGLEQTLSEMLKISNEQPSEIYIFIHHFRGDNRDRYDTASENNIKASIASIVFGNKVEAVRCNADIYDTGNIINTRELTIENKTVQSEDLVSASSSGPSRTANHCELCKNIVSVVDKLSMVTTAAVCAAVGALMSGGAQGSVTTAVCTQVAQNVINYMRNNTSKSPESVCKQLGYCD